MLVEAEVCSKPMEAIVYMAKTLADELNLSYAKEVGFVKCVNAKCLQISGVARGTKICFGQWQGTIDITIAPLDDNKFYLGIDFLTEVQALLAPYANTMCIMQNEQPCVVSIKR